jgi:hypothetical protein
MTSLFYCFEQFTYLKIRKKSSFLFFHNYYAFIDTQQRTERGNAHMQ